MHPRNVQLLGQVTGVDTKLVALDTEEISVTSPLSLITQPVAGTIAIASVFT